MSANKNTRELSWLSDILDTKIDKNIFIRKKKIKMLPWPISAKFDTSYQTLYITKQQFFSITSKKCFSWDNGQKYFPLLQLIFLFTIRLKFFSGIFGSFRKLVETKKKLNGCWWPQQEFLGPVELLRELSFFNDFFFQNIQHKILHVEI